jgi:hypothetical protein
LKANKKGEADMVDPGTLSLAAVGTVALTEGIKFLYSQAGDLLKRWRDHKQKAVQKAKKQEDLTGEIKINLPAVFDGQISINPKINYSVIQKTEEGLNKLHNDLSKYATGTSQIDTTNSDLLEKIDRLRKILESVYQQNITFKGENRSPSGSPVVTARFRAKKFAGTLTVVEAMHMESGKISGDADIDWVEPKGTVKIVKVNTIGGRPRRKRASKNKS